jgi:hypothetical protein
VIDVVKRYELEQGYETHPIGMTMQFPVADQTGVNDPLFNSPADWISPGYDDEIFANGRHPMEPDSSPSRWYDNPPASDGRKVVITDTDHYAPGKGDPLWAWKSFLRGHHPILMDFGLIDSVHPPDPSAGPTAYESYEPARFAMGDTLRYARKMNLLAMEPRVELSSTGYALANPGVEYLVLQPDETAEGFMVELAPGSYAIEWYSVASRETRQTGTLVVERAGGVSFTASFARAGPVVLYLKKSGDEDHE